MGKLLKIRLDNLFMGLNPDMITDMEIYDIITCLNNEMPFYIQTEFCCRGHPLDSARKNYGPWVQYYFSDIDGFNFTKSIGERLKDAFEANTEPKCSIDAELGLKIFPFESNLSRRFWEKDMSKYFWKKKDEILDIINENLPHIISTKIYRKTSPCPINRYRYYNQTNRVIHCFGEIGKPAIELKIEPGGFDYIGQLQKDIEKEIDVALRIDGYRADIEGKRLLHMPYEDFEKGIIVFWDVFRHVLSEYKRHSD